MDGIYKQIEYKINLLSEYAADREEVDDVWQDFNMIYTDIVVNKQSKEQLLEHMSAQGILDRMERVSETITNRDMLRQYQSVEIPIVMKTIRQNICDFCGEDMIQSYDKTSYDCLNCNISKPVHNTLIDTTKAIPRSKIGNFNPERHFRTWMDRILARESEDEIRSGQYDNCGQIIDLIRDGLRSKSKSIEHITIDDIRLGLKELGMTSLNKNTSLIAKKITGRSPPYFTEEQYMRVHSLFAQVMESRDKIDSIKKCNRIYYPYYIAKILDLILTDPEQRKILNYIHLHKETTLTSNDVGWEEICKIVPFLKGKYRATVPSTNRYI